MKLTIKRSKWLRGEGSSASTLLRESDGKMCCLGFYALALGADKESICGVQEPTRDGESEGLYWPKNTWRDLSGPSDTINNLMQENDDRYIDEGEREQAIKAEFAKLDVIVKFIK